MRLITDKCGKLINDIRVTDVLFLRCFRQGQVILYEPGNSARVVLPQSVLKAEGLGVNCAQLGVITAAAFRDVVKEAGQVRDFGFLYPLHDATTVRIFMVEAAQRESPQVTDNKQGVFIDCIRVEEVVLHAPDNAAKRRQVQTEYAVQIHSPEPVRNTCGCAQD